MRVMIALLRGVNVGGHHKIKMEELRALFASLKLRDAQTYIQSGNVVFRTDERDSGKVSQQIQKGIEKRFGFRVDAVVRTAAELRDVVARNPFAKRKEIAPGKLSVTFLASDPGEEARETVRKMKTDPEELRIDGCEAYLYFPNGMGRPKLSWPAVERVLKTSGTGRNWNSVRALLEMAEKLEALK